MRQHSVFVPLRRRTFASLTLCAGIASVLAPPLLAQETGAAPAGEPSVPVPPAPAAPAPVGPMAVPPATKPGIDPLAQALLETTAEKYGGLKGYQASVETKIDDTVISREQLQYRATGALRSTEIDSEGKSGVVQLLANNKIFVLQEVNDVWEWVSKPLPPMAPGESFQSRIAGLGVGGRSFSRILGGFFPISRGEMTLLQSLKTGTVTQFNGVPVDTIVATFASPKAPGVKRITTFFLGRADSLVYGIEQEAKMADGKSTRSRQTFSNIQANPDFATNAFYFTPPKGAKHVAQFSEPVVKAKVGQLLAAFTAKDLNGKPLSLAQYKGKVVLVDFWATWCGPCVGELPNVKAAYKKYHAQGFDVVGISLDMNPGKVKSFIAQEKMPWRQVWDGYWSGPLAKTFNIKAIPATLILDRQGRVSAINARDTSLEPAIRKALAKK